MSNYDYQPRDGYGSKVDESRCRASVMYYIGRWPKTKQCNFKPRDGTNYCRIHQPDKAKIREEKVRKAQDEKWEKQKRQWKYGYYGLKLREALEQIRDGHNDPRALAREILEEIGE